MGAPPGSQAVCRKNDSNVEEHSLRNVSLLPLVSSVRNQQEAYFLLDGYSKYGRGNTCMMPKRVCYSGEEEPLHLALYSLDTQNMQQKPSFPKVFPDLPFYLFDPHLVLFTPCVPSGSSNSPSVHLLHTWLTVQCHPLEVEQQRSLKDVSF